MIIQKGGIICFCIFLLLFSTICGLETEKEITKEQASSAITKAGLDMQEMKDAGFSTVYINDTLTIAKQTFEKIGNAKKMNISGFTYNEVSKYTDEISVRKEKAYNLSDEIRALELKINDYENIGVNIDKTSVLLEQAKTAFKEERYEDAEQALIDTELQFESDRAEITLTSVVTRAGKNFIQKYWVYLIITIIVLLSVAYITWKKIKKTKAKNKLKIARMEQDAITDLIKDVQRQRFENGTISDTTYRIKMKFLKEKLTELKHTIPVLESIIKGKK
jgi:hypothetical protein